MKPFNMELPVMSSVFNLALIDAPDMDRVLEDDRKRIAAECEARAFESKMQKLLEVCPGFVGADIPKSENAAGRIVVQPGLAPEALR